MSVKRIAPGLYRIADKDILFRKPGRCLPLTKHNRQSKNATVKCSTWVLCRTGYDDADLLEFMEINKWRSCPGEQLSEYDTKKEALETTK